MTDMVSSCISKMTNLYESSGIPVFIFNDDMIIVWHNDSFSSYFSNKIQNGAGLNALTGIHVRKKIYKSAGLSCRILFTFRSEGKLSSDVSMMIFPLEKNSEGAFLFIGYVDDLTNEKKLLLRKTYLGLLEASKLKDDDTGNHIKRVGAYAKRLSEELFKLDRYKEIDPDFIENIHFLAPMHDVGKIGTPDDILTKRGPLDDGEWSIMKEHTINGALILSNYPEEMAGLIARSHHEKWNGSGYPYGLSEELIPLSARITAIADVYDALRMKRSYKEAYSHSKTLEIIREGAGSHFDPYLIDVFFEISSGFEGIYNALSDSDIKDSDSIEELPVYYEDKETGNPGSLEELEELEELDELEELEEL